MSVFSTQTIEVADPVMVDDRGTQVPTWEGATYVPVSGCDIQPGASREVILARQGVQIRWTVYAPVDAPVTAHSAVRYQGRVYQIDGEPQRWTGSLSGYLDHVVMYLVDWAG